MEIFKVIIAGSRDFGDYGLLRERCDRILSEKRLTHSVVIVSGAARGADRLGERYARERGLGLERKAADWNTYGNAAGSIRNAEMASEADALIAFWDGKSRGTSNMIDLARMRNLQIRVIRINQKRM